MKNVLWKVATCIAVVLMSFSVYSCGDDDEDSVGSRELLLGKWTGVYYLDQTWEDGEMVGDHKEDFVNGTNHQYFEFKEDGTYVEKSVQVSSQNTHFSYGKWTYSGNKLTFIDNEGGEEEQEVWTVTKMTENELIFEIRGKETEDGCVYEFLEQYSLVR